MTNHWSERCSRTFGMNFRRHNLLKTILWLNHSLLHRLFTHAINRVSNLLQTHPSTSLTPKTNSLERKMFQCGIKAYRKVLYTGSGGTDELVTVWGSRLLMNRKRRRTQIRTKRRCWSTAWVSSVTEKSTTLSFRLPPSRLCPRTIPLSTWPRSWS